MNLALSILRREVFFMSEKDFMGTRDGEQDTTKW